MRVLFAAAMDDGRLVSGARKGRKKARPEQIARAHLACQIICAFRSG